jgi:hypothetical protein
MLIQLLELNSGIQFFPYGWQIRLTCICVKIPPNMHCTSTSHYIKSSNRSTSTMCFTHTSQTASSA